MVPIILTYIQAIAGVGVEGKAVYEVICGLVVRTGSLQELPVRERMRTCADWEEHLFFEAWYILLLIFKFNR